jgi:hypothetical protein
VFPREPIERFHDRPRPGRDAPPVHALKELSERVPLSLLCPPRNPLTPESTAESDVSSFTAGCRRTESPSARAAEPNRVSPRDLGCGRGLRSVRERKPRKLKADMR